MMQNHNNKYTNILLIIFIFIIALMFDALILKDFHFEYESKISLTDIIGLIVTIVLALYIAHVVEAGREHKKNIETILGSVIQSLLTECDEVQHATYENHLNYLQAIAFPTNIYRSCTNMLAMMDKFNFSCPEANRLIAKLKRNTTLKKLLTEITYMADDPDNYLMVSDNICDISPSRIGKIQGKVADIKRDLYSLWAEINLQ